ncbi:MAG: tRNA epoxyqueuosine(34) reductase QueG, partial [Pseudomonadales bacterium]|nr:tRNA epoxyqueuosine(34) reductase QueG [Pseudomonadales bacterium]
MRCRPAELVEGTRTVITVRMNYRPASADPVAVLASDRTAYVSRYALGRDYHKVMRARLVKLWNRVADFLRAAGIDDARGRVFTDSAPVMEKALAEQSGIGWIGKNTLLLTRDAGSWFFLGEIFTNLPLAVDAPMETEHCGSCDACITACPTGAIVAPYELDAKKCISYLTIEKRGSIPVALREAIGNRIFGCDDCQLVCPWNKFARPTRESDFSPRHGLDNTGLVELFLWTEDEFLARTEGSAIRRAGYEGWLRNLAVALGNGPASKEAKSALLSRRDEASEMVAEHIDWALEQLERRGVAG